MRFVIVGNGVAGMEAALTIKEREPSANVTIVSEESDHFFSRTALMWVFTGQLSHRCIEPLERDAYRRLGITRVRARATGVDLENKALQLGGDLGPLPFDRLIIASGSRPRPAPWPGSDLEGVGHFVTHQDLAWLEWEVAGGPSKAGGPPRPEAHLDSSEPSSPYWPRPVAAKRRGALSKHPAVVGGGLIGIEAVEVMLNQGLRPHFFIRDEWFWPMAIEPRESRWITERMEDHGVQVHRSHNIEEIEGEEGMVTGVRTDHGRYDVDCLVVAIGVMPNTEWLSNSGIGLHPRGGIPVDRSLQTDTEGVYAAGDCAIVEWFDGSKRPEQLWYTARDQGRMAGRSALGERVQYQRPIWYNSAKLMDIEYTTAGLVNMRVEGEKNWFYEETGKVRSTTRIVVEGDRVIGFNLLGRRWDHTILNQWIQQRRTLDWVLEHLHEASFDTEFVPRLKIPKAAKKQPLEGAAPNPAVKQTNRFTFA